MMNFLTKEDKIEFKKNWRETQRANKVEIAKNKKLNKTLKKESKEARK